MGNELKCTMHLKLHGIAVLYLPYAEHPVDFGRKSGFLIRKSGIPASRLHPGRRLLLGAEPKHRRHLGRRSTRRALAQLGTSAPLVQLRFASRLLRVIDEKGAPVTHQNQGGEDLRVNGWKDLPDGFRA